MGREHDLKRLTDMLQNESQRISDSNWPRFLETTAAVLPTQIATFTSRAHLDHMRQNYEEGRVKGKPKKVGIAYYDFESQHAPAILEGHLPLIKTAFNLHEKMTLHLVSGLKNLRALPIPAGLNGWESSRDRLRWHCIVGEMPAFPNYVAGVELYKLSDAPTDSPYERQKMNLTAVFDEESYGRDSHWFVGKELHCSCNTVGDDEQDDKWLLREAVMQYKKNYGSDFNYKGIEKALELE